jgi:RimJ/RimL family protein N-acetyltransferase
VISTARLLLTAATPDDVDRLHTIDIDPEVMRYINGGEPTTREEVAARINEAAGLLWVATLHETGEMIGWFAGRQTGDDEYELGYRLRRTSWGNGLAAEGARAVVEYALNVLGAGRVWGQTMTVNVASRRVMERCGLRYVRTFFTEWPEGPINGSEHGDVEYERLRP